MIFPASISFPSIAHFPAPIGAQPEIFTVNFTGVDGNVMLNGGPDTTGLSLIFYDLGNAETYTWGNTNNGDNNDPESAPSGFYFAPDGTDTASQVATAFASGMSSNADYTCVAVGTLVTCTAKTNEARTNAFDVDIGVTIITTQEGHA